MTFGKLLFKSVIMKELTLYIVHVHVFDYIFSLQ